MSQISEYDSPILRREAMPWGVGRYISITLPFQSTASNDRLFAEPACCFRDNLSVRSMGAMSPFYTSRPASPISERDPVTWALHLGMMENAKHIQANQQPLTPTTQSTKQLPPFPQQKTLSTPPLVARAEIGVQTNDVVFRFPKTGLSSRRIVKKRSRKTRSFEIPREDAEREMMSVCRPTPPPLDPHLRSKISKVRSFWNKSNRVFPTTFKVIFLCPQKKQSEFLDFSRKEILLDEHMTSSNDILFKSNPYDDSVSNSRSIQSPWADDYEQVTFTH